MKKRNWNWEPCLILSFHEPLLALVVFLNVNFSRSSSSYVRLLFSVGHPSCIWMKEIQRLCVLQIMCLPLQQTTVSHWRLRRKLQTFARVVSICPHWLNLSKNDNPRSCNQISEDSARCLDTAADLPVAMGSYACAMKYYVSHDRISHRLASSSQLGHCRGVNSALVEFYWNSRLLLLSYCVSECSVRIFYPEAVTPVVRACRLVAWPRGPHHAGSLCGSGPSPDSECVPFWSIFISSTIGPTADALPP